MLNDFENKAMQEKLFCNISVENQHAPSFDMFFQLERHLEIFFDGSLIGRHARDNFLTFTPFLFPKCEKKIHIIAAEDVSG